MEDGAASPRTHPSIDRKGRPGGEPEQVLYRRRQTDWLSGAATAEESSDQPETAARRAAIELAKATLIARDGLTSDHSDDVGLLCEAIAQQLHLEEQERSDLMAAAQLHDIGKVGVPESILQKPAPLTEDEWEIMRQHTPTGERILSAVPELRDVAVIVRHSHEHWDGSGYPDGLAGDEIPLASRIILCADAFHAVRSPRPYRAGRCARDAFEEVQAHTGGQFDPTVVAALERTVADVRTARPGGRRFVPARAMLGSRRLAALLLTLAMAGGAFAASRLGNEEPAEANPGQGAADSRQAATDSSAGCVKNCSSWRRSIPALAPSLAWSPPARPARQRARGPRRGPSRSDGARAVRRPRSRVKLPAAPQAPARGVAPVPRRTAPVPGPSPKRPAAQAPTRPPTTRAPTRAPAVRPPRGTQRPRGTGNGYGHRKRLLNPHPPKPPPGRMKPKQNP